MKKSTKEKREKTKWEKDSLRRENWNRQINLHQYKPWKKQKLKELKPHHGRSNIKPLNIAPWEELQWITKESSQEERDCYEFRKEVQYTNTFEWTKEIRKKVNHFEWWRKRMDRKFYLCYTLFISNTFTINRQKIIYWFVNLNFNLMFSYSAQGWRKKVKINKLINSGISFYP